MKVLFLKAACQSQKKMHNPSLSIRVNLLESFQIQETVELYAKCHKWRKTSSSLSSNITFPSYHTLYKADAHTASHHKLHSIPKDMFSLSYPNSMSHVPANLGVCLSSMISLQCSGCALPRFLDED